MDNKEICAKCGRKFSTGEVIHLHENKVKEAFYDAVCGDCHIKEVEDFTAEYDRKIDARIAADKELHEHIRRLFSFLAAPKEIAQ